MDYNSEIKKLIQDSGGAFCGFASFSHCGLQNAISFGVKLSDFVLSQIENEPTYTYFTHYRTANALIDRIEFILGSFIEKEGFLYMPIPASQTVDGHDSYRGEASHKKAAFLSGMGYIGKNALFIHKDYGSKVRLGTVFTNMPLITDKPLRNNICGDCRICASICPAQAIYGKNFDIKNPQAELIDKKACSSYMKREFGHIGRGSVCGICIKNCPHNKLKKI